MTRCIVCGWPIAKAQGIGCLPGDCSYRPDDPAERAKIRARRAQIERVAQAFKAEYDATDNTVSEIYIGDARTRAERIIRAYEGG